MSRGMGRIQRVCLELVTNSESSMSTLEIVQHVMGHQAVTESEIASCRRALRGLVKAGALSELGRRYVGGRRHWSSVEVAKSTRKRMRAMGWR